MITLCRQDLIDVLNGSAVLGSGGGGRMREALNLLEAALAMKKPIVLQQLDKIPPLAMLCAPFLMGDMSEDRDVNQPHPHSEHPPIINALRRLENHVGNTVSGVFPVEMGACNVALAFCVAAVLSNGFVVDADPVGRSVPELSYASLSMAGLPQTPFTATNSLGENFLVDSAADYERQEEVLRALCVLSKNRICGVDHMMNVELLRPRLLSGTVSKAWAIGRSMRQATEAGKDVADAIATHCRGRVLFRGHVRYLNRIEEGGFCSGDVQVAGCNGFEGETYRLRIPEIIAIVDMKQVLSISNPLLEIGMEVAVVALPAPEHFLTKQGLRAFGPKYVGLNDPFRSALDVSNKE
ncbi:hypothetical protein FGB62_223g012 [Gracilaria domingensis]|nr:hypothetical protein FGB62_223g012 [Gracilaria domingensis]